MNHPPVGTLPQSSVFRRRARGPLLGSIAALLLGSAAPLFAAFVPVGSSGTWLQNPGSNDWNTGTNWSGNAVPTVTANFATSSITTVTLSANATVNNIVFSPGASVFTIAALNGATLTINGAGINNSSGVMQILVSGPNTSGISSQITFSGSASAGSNISINSDGALASGGFAGATNFTGNSSAGSSTLFALGGTNGGAGGAIYFTQQATGGTARVILLGNGFLDISGLTAPTTSVTIGSLASGTYHGGEVFLGAYNLTVGSDNRNTSFGGVIQDGGSYGGAGGSLTKIGTGTLTLNGANTYTGSTLVSAGSLIVDGSIASPLTTVNPGALLGGSGTIGGNLATGGSVSPGNAPAALTVKGNYTQSSSGALLIGVGGLASNQSDLLVVGGKATLAGALQLQPLNGFKFTTPGQEVTFLTAAGGVTGKFSNIQNLATFNGSSALTTQVIYLPGAVELEATQSSIYGQLHGLPGVTGNDLQTAKILDTAANNPGAAKLFDVLNQANLSQLIKDVELIDPGQLAALSNIGSALANETLLSLEQRFIAIQNSGVGGPAGPDGKGGKEIPPPAAGNRWGSFITGSGDFERVDDTSSSRGFNMDAGGVTFGIDYRFTDHLAAGLFGSYTNTGIDIANGGRINVNTGKWGLYGTYFDGGFYVNSALEGGYSSYDNHRNALGGTARSDADGGDFSALFAPGYNWTMGGLTFGPTTRFQYTYQAVDGFTESGSLAPMAIGSQHTESIVTGLGVKASYDWKVGRAIIRPELRLEWEHEYGDTATGIDAQLAGGASNAFRFTSPGVGRDDLHLGAGVAVVFSDRVTAYAYYDGQFFRTNYDDSVVTAGFRVSF